MSKLAEEKFYPGIAEMLRPFVVTESDGSESLDPQIVAKIDGLWNKFQNFMSQTPPQFRSLISLSDDWSDVRVSQNTLENYFLGLIPLFLKLFEKGAGSLIKDSTSIFNDPEAFNRMVATLIIEMQSAKMDKEIVTGDKAIAYIKSLGYKTDSSPITDIKAGTSGATESGIQDGGTTSVNSFLDPDVNFKK